MSLGQNKKGLEFQALIEILLVIIAVGLFITVIQIASSRAEVKTSENLCRGVNALAFATKVETGLGSFNLVPVRTCKTINKKDIPDKDYKNYVLGEKEGAKAEIRDMMARCWWMWLEGYQQNMFDKKFYQLKQKCFTCYTFSMDKNIQPFDYNEFAASLDAPYIAIDTSNRCASGGGGKCMKSCDKSSNYFSKQTSSNQCEQDEQCCIANDPRDECKNKGGKCLSSREGEYTEYYSKWQCKEGACYLKKENIASYLDYIQGTKGVSGGAGKVLFFDNDGFKPDSKYAVTFVSPGKDLAIDNILGLGATGLGLYVVGAGLASGIGTIPTLIAVGLTAGAAATTSATGVTKDINYIAVSKYDTVSKKCAIEAGPAEK